MLTIMGGPGTAIRMRPKQNTQVIGIKRITTYSHLSM